ncbi:MAG: 1-acyl-sn-glycerol-3-phosphate acyltransferase [Candidatus Thiodiazotropha sp. (ex Lucinoma aequizonata)]|nr:1-acyl-sn-glycerol-3-phosphate acyltransferase [Candidatus Thiodiazotropha sp. (ex Lucinoma aequizonata)]MCU7889736.1 1-acyl-sn-glycerol-3-phosphate acyltransferase [Candidatus Thiodiazotropha sp. (ex Lucinoma aequizonata)]MCU7897142.1 1-acyl-sn-glycerol-3-phosphate acyltransferase [Candidatus Thiodiazotropha sp. (ex Lucinoma aequizonata)]MCU7897850.1 1-acyl-sn-glycerol-3-phosphate acyltransferase [Candidatus Thiodiazotropha sp. (ex Lucinoma aequizonata)]MCU7901070.1 1-acyl-sn-glycerol-3-pho
MTTTSDKPTQPNHIIPPRLTCYRFNLSVLLLYVPSGVILLIYLMFNPIFPKVGAWLHYIGPRWTARNLIRLCGGKIRTFNLDRLHTLQDYPLVIFCNHNSRFDAYILLATMPFSFKSFWSTSAHVTTERWNEIRFAGNMLDLYFLHDKSNVRKTVQEFRKATDFVVNGGTLSFFPEGAFTPDEVVGPFGPAYAKLTIESGATLLPVIISGAEQLFESVAEGKNKVCELHVCEPMSLNAYTRKDAQRLSEEIRTLITQKYLSISRDAP